MLNSDGCAASARPRTLAVAVSGWKARPTRERRGARGAVGLFVLLALGLAGAALAEAQELTGSQILSKALDLRKGINDFSARFAIHLDVESLDIPDSSGTVYFKRPDKLRVVGERGLVILPKDAIMPTRIAKAIEDGADVTLMGKRDTPAAVIYGLKIVPKQDDQNVRLLAWINGRNWTMQKMEVWRGTRRAMSIDWEHTLVQKRFWLPKSVTCTLGQRARPDRRRMKGTASVTFTDYRVNSGLDDALFSTPEERR